MIWNIVTIPVSKQEALKFMFLLFVHGVYFLSDFNGFFLNEFLTRIPFRKIHTVFYIKVTQNWEVSHFELFYFSNYFNAFFLVQNHHLNVPFNKLFWYFISKWGRKGSRIPTFRTLGRYRSTLQLDRIILSFRKPSLGLSSF